MWTVLVSPPLTCAVLVIFSPGCTSLKLALIVISALSPGSIVLLSFTASNVFVAESYFTVNCLVPVTFISVSFGLILS